MRRLGFSFKSEQASRPLLAATHAGFVLSGVVTTLLGPILPALSAKWAITDVQAGYLFTAQSLGTLVGIGISGRLTRRIGWVRGLSVGFALMCAGVTALGFSSWPLGLAAVCLYGSALGITLPLTNLLVSSIYPARRAESLNILNVLWGLGAVIGPPIIVVLSRYGGQAVPLVVLALWSAATALWLRQCPAVDFGENSKAFETTGRLEFAAFRNGFVVLLGLLAFLYVGSENAVGGWIALYATRISATESIWAWTPSAFWASLLLGRALSPAALRYLTEERLVLAGVAMATVGLSFLLTAHSVVVLLAGVALAGIGFGPVFPTSLASATHRLGRSAPRVVSLIFALGTMGSATLPWSVGFLSTRYGSLRTGLLVPMVGSVTLVLVQAGIMLLLYLARGPRLSESVGQRLEV